MTDNNQERPDDAGLYHNRAHKELGRVRAAKSVKVDNNQELHKLAREIALCLACHGTGFTHAKMSGFGAQLGPKCMPCEGTGHRINLARLQQLLDQHKREVAAAYERGRREARWVTLSQISDETHTGPLQLYVVDGQVVGAVEEKDWDSGKAWQVWEPGKESDDYFDYMTDHEPETEARAWVEAHCQGSKREQREEKLRHLGFDEPTDNERKERLARTMAGKDWPQGEGGENEQS